MRILVLSDTHRKKQMLKSLLYELDPAANFDAIFHLGDNTADILEMDLPEVPIHVVRGNCDFNKEPLIKEVRMMGKKIILTHGHNYHVKSSLMRLGLLAAEREADAVLFGHTHMPYTQYIGTGALLFNPGSFGEPRSRSGHTYGVLTLSKDKVKAEVVKFEV